MTGGRSVRVDWAVNSKEKDGVGYQILRASDGPASFGHYATLIDTIDPGLPDQGKGAAPYVSFVTAENSLGGLTGVSVVEWGEGTDRKKRPIVQTRFFCLPTRTRLESRYSYLALWAAVRQEPLAVGTEGPISVEVHEPGPASGPGYPAGGPLSFRWAAGVAAALLERPVIVVGYRRADPEAALRDLDQIADLLPFGFRATMNVGTWTKNSRIATHLAFGPRHVGASPGSYREIEWGGSEGVPEDQLEAPARRYLRNLLDLYEEYGRDAAEITRGLRGAAEPHQLAPQSAEWANQVVEDLNRILITFKLITDETGRLRLDPAGGLHPDIRGHLDEVLQVVRDNPYGAVREDRRAVFIGYLHLHPDLRALRDLPETWWAAETGLSADAVLTELAASAGASAAAGAWASPASDFGPGLGARLLATAVSARQVDPVQGERKLDILWSSLFDRAEVFGDPAAAGGLVKLWCSWGERFRVPLLETYERLVEDEGICKPLLYAETLLGQGALDLLLKLEPGRHKAAWFAPLRLVLPESRGTVSKAELARFVAGPDVHTDLLLRLARTADRVDTVLARAADALLTTIPADPRRLDPQRRALARFAAEPLPAPAAYQTLVIVDLVNVRLGREIHTTYLAGLADPDQIEEYAGALLAQTSQEAAAPGQRLFATAVARAVGDGPGPVPLWAGLVLAGLLRDGADGTRRAIADTAAEWVRVVPTLSSDLHLPLGFWTLVRANVGESRGELLYHQIYSELTHFSQTAQDPESLAELCGEAVGSGCEPLEVLRRLDAWPSRSNVEHAVRFFDKAAQSAGAGGWITFEEFVVFVIGGDWGSGASEAFLENRKQILESEIADLVTQSGEQKAEHEQQKLLAQGKLSDLAEQAEREQADVERRTREKIAADLAVREQNCAEIQAEADRRMASIVERRDVEQHEEKVAHESERQKITAAGERDAKEIADTARSQAKPLRTSLKNAEAAIGQIEQDVRAKVEDRREKSRHYTELSMQRQRKPVDPRPATRPEPVARTGSVYHDFAVFDDDLVDFGQGGDGRPEMTDIKLPEFIQIDDYRRGSQPADTGWGEPGAGGGYGHPYSGWFGNQAGAPLAPAGTGPGQFEEPARERPVEPDGGAAIAEAVPVLKSRKSIWRWRRSIDDQSPKPFGVTGDGADGPS